MKPDGIYLAEDLHTNYWPEYLTYAGGMTFVDLRAILFTGFMMSIRDIIRNLVDLPLKIPPVQSA